MGGRWGGGRGGVDDVIKNVLFFRNSCKNAIKMFSLLKHIARVEREV